MTFEKDNRDRIERPHLPAVPGHVGVGLPRGNRRHATTCGSGTSPTSTPTEEGVARRARAERGLQPEERALPRGSRPRVRHYFLLDRPNRALRDSTRLVRRLQRMDVDVYRLTEPLEVDDFHAVRRPRVQPGHCRSAPYWIPMAQGQKHWIQAMLHEETYIPYKVTYDVTSWSNPLLLNLQGGWTGDVLTPRAVPVGADTGAIVGRTRRPAARWACSRSRTPLAASSRPVRRGTSSSTCGDLPYRSVTADQIIRRAARTSTSWSFPTATPTTPCRRLGLRASAPCKNWVAGGGRFVGWQGGTRVAIKSGLSSATLTGTHANAPGTLIRTTLDADSPLAAGVGSTVWVMYDNNDTMTSRYSVGRVPGTRFERLRHIWAGRAHRRALRHQHRCRRTPPCGTGRDLRDRPELPRLDAWHPPAAVERHHRSGPCQPRWGPARSGRADASCSSGRARPNDAPRR